MAIDRQAIVSALAVPGLAPRTSLVPPGVQELPNVAQPVWADQSLAQRRNEARRLLDGARVADAAASARRDARGARLPHDLRSFAARLAADRRRGRARARPDSRPTCILIDEVAPANLASWYLRHFTCEASGICDPAADEALQAARLAPAPPSDRRSSRWPTGY